MRDPQQRILHMLVLVQTVCPLCTVSVRLRIYSHRTDVAQILVASYTSDTYLACTNLFWWDCLSLAVYFSASTKQTLIHAVVLRSSRGAYSVPVFAACEWGNETPSEKSRLLLLFLLSIWFCLLSVVFAGFPWADLVGEAMLVELARWGVLA